MTRPQNLLMGLTFPLPCTPGSALSVCWTNVFALVCSVGKAPKDVTVLRIPGRCSPFSGALCQGPGVPGLSSGPGPSPAASAAGVGAGAGQAGPTVDAEARFLPSRKPRGSDVRSERVPFSSSRPLSSCRPARSPSDSPPCQLSVFLCSCPSSVSAPLPLLSLPGSVRLCGSGSLSVCLPPSSGLYALCLSVCLPAFFSFGL